MKQLIKNSRTRDGSGGGRAFPAVLFVFLIVLSVLCITGNGMSYAGAVQAGSETSITMDVTYGFGDTAKGDRYLPVRITLENKEMVDFSGTLDILTTESSMEVYQYDYPVSIDASGTVQETCYIPLGVKSDQIFVTLKKNDGSQVIKKRLKLNISSEVSEVFIGTLCNTPDALSYLNEAGIRYGSIKTKLVELNKDTVPEDHRGFDQLDLMIVNNYNLDELSDKQRDALMRWVEDGGTLLFGGGVGYRENMGKLTSDLLEPPYETPVIKQVNLGAEYSENAPQDAMLDLMCADLNLKDGNTLISGDGFSLLSFSHRNKGRIAVVAFDLQDIGDFCGNHPGFIEKFITLIFGESRTEELSQMDYYGFSNLYFSAQGLINTGNTNRLPNVFLYTLIIILYILLIGPGLYLFLKKKSLQRYYIGGVAVCALLFTAIIYIMGIKTRFRGPFFTYATILDTSETETEEETFINVRSPFNKPYTVTLNPEYVVRPITRSYYYDSVSIPKFTGEEGYKAAIVTKTDRTELHVRDTAAFTPKMFTMSKSIPKDKESGIQGSVCFFDGEIRGTVVNHFDYRLENAALLLYGKAVILGNMEPGQEIKLDGKEVLNYPLNYTNAFAQAVTGADQYEKADISDETYMLAQERTRLLAFYMDGNMNVYTPEARFVAFSPDKNQREFLQEGDFVTEGITLVTAAIDLEREQNGRIYHSALEQEPRSISGNYQPRYNSMYAGEPSESVVVEYSLGNDLEVEKLTLESLSSVFQGNPKYPYLSAFKGKMYFYNYDTGHNDLMKAEQLEYTSWELRPYLSPSNTITIKYISEGTGEYGGDQLLPMIYAVGRRK
ncbi:MAG: hypothetical protein RR930_01865 [Clostridium sp.]